MDSPNLEKWRYYCKDFPTTDLYVDVAWYWMISAALQRRVWIGSEAEGIFPNQYIIFVADPGVGKSLALSPVNTIMRGIIDPRHQTEVGAPKPTLFRIGANSTTYERFIHFCAASAQVVRTSDGTIHKHISPCLILDELTSIFKDHAQDMSTFLLEAWKARDYTRDTFTHKTQTLTNICLNMIATTQPDKLAELRKSVDILGSGFSRRVLWVWGDKNRCKTLCIVHAPDQVAALNSLRPYVAGLSNLYGQVSFTPEALEYLNSWHGAPGYITNHATCLEFYYANKHLHAQKLAMAIHFSENNKDFEIPAWTVQKAVRLLETIEASMDMVFTGSSSTRERIVRGVTTLLKNGPLPEVVLYRQFVRDVPFQFFQTIMDDMALSSQIILEQPSTRTWKRGPLAL